MANCLSSGSMLGKPAWPNTWRGGGDLRRRAGRPSFAIMQRASRRWTCSCADGVIPVALRALNYGAQPTADLVAWCNGASDRRVDRQSTHGSVRLGAATRLCDPGPGCLLWQRVHPPPSLSRHSRSPDFAALTLAEWLCRAFDRLDPAGVP